MITGVDSCTLPNCREKVTTSLGKMSLIEFLTKESAELVHQHEQLAEISDVFAQIKQLYEKTDVEVCFCFVYEFLF